jgi:TolB-like protein
MQLLPDVTSFLKPSQHPDVRRMKKNQKERYASDEKLNAEIRRIVADAKKKWNALSRSERAKCRELMKNFVIHGDLSRAAERAGISSDLVDKLLSVHRPATVFDIRYTASGNLMRAKLRQGVPVGAKIAARNLKAHSSIILNAAERNDQKFFRELGKCLSGRSKPEWTSAMSRDVASIFVLKPDIPAKEGVRLLRELGWTMTEDDFRMWKKRLGVTATTAKRSVILRAGPSRET